MHGSLPSARLALVALLVSFGGSFHFGYQLTITNPSQAAFISFVNDSYAIHYGHDLDEDDLEVGLKIVALELAVMKRAGSVRDPCRPENGTSARYIGHSGPFFRLVLAWDGPRNGSDAERIPFPCRAGPRKCLF